MDDKNKLEAWKALLNQTGQVMTSAQCSQAWPTCSARHKRTSGKAESGGLGSDTLTTMVTSSLDGADVYSAVAVLAAVCNYNPVIFLKYPANYVFQGGSAYPRRRTPSLTAFRTQACPGAVTQRPQVAARSSTAIMRRSLPTSSAYARRHQRRRWDDGARQHGDGLGSRKCRTATPTT